MTLLPLAQAGGMVLCTHPPCVRPTTFRPVNILPALSYHAKHRLEKAQNPTFLSGQLESRCAFLSIEQGSLKK